MVSPARFFAALTRKQGQSPYFAHEEVPSNQGASGAKCVDCPKFSRCGLFNHGLLGVKGRPRALRNGRKIETPMQQIGRYIVVRELGRGAMGVVFEARDPLIGRIVAVKIIRLGALGTSSQTDWLQERLFREARSAGTLSHPGIVVIFDLG